MIEPPGSIPKKDYFRVKNDWWDALLRCNIPGNARRCMDYIIRRTYGWQKKEAEIPILDFVEATGLKKPHVSRAIKYLRLSKMVTVTKNGNTKHLTYSFNKNYKQWEPNLVTISGNKKTVTISGNKQLPYLVTNDTISGNSHLLKKEQSREQLKNTSMGNGFDAFWKAYPVKKSKKAAFEKWNVLKKKNDLPPLDDILTAIQNQIQERKIKASKNQFVPEWKHPATWLNQQCWEDDCTIQPEIDPWEML